MDNLGFGLQVTAIGMGLVFGMLLALWALLTLALRLEARSGSPDATPPADAWTDDRGFPSRAAETRVRIDGPDTDGLDPRLVAAVTVAILRHAEARRLQAAPAMRSSRPGSLLFASRWVAAGRTRQGQSWRRRR